MPVDEIGGLGKPQVTACRLLDDNELRRGRLAHRAGHHRGEAGALCADCPVLLKRDYGLVIDGIADFSGQIACGAVRQPSDDYDGLSLTHGGEHSLARIDFESLQARAFRTVRCVLPQPGEDGGVLVRLIGHELAAAVSDGEAWLGQQQRLFWRLGRDSPAALLVHDHVVVEARVRTVQGQPEAVLTGWRTVAG